MAPHRTDDDENRQSQQPNPSGDPRAAYDRQDSGDSRPLPAGSWRRGQEPEFSRLANFNDAIYAIALTLLVLQVGISPVKESASVDEMADAIGAQLPNLFAFALAFVLIARYWMAHHAFFAMLRAWNQQIMGITLVYLAFVAVLPFPTFLMGEYGDNPLAIVVFAGTMACISALEVLMYARAHHLELMHERLSPQAYKWGFRASMLPVGMFVLTMPLAFISPYLTLCSWPVIGIGGGILLKRSAPAEVSNAPGATMSVDRGARYRHLGATGATNPTSSVSADDEANEAAESG